MNRQQRRESETKVYSTKECVKMMNAIQKELICKFNIRYSACLATSLSAPPFNLTNEQVCEIIRLFFSQVDAINAGAIEEDDILTEAGKIGITFQVHNDNFVVNISPKEGIK